MSSKNEKSCIGSKRDLNAKTKKNKAEVFVLPPNILEKLGINLTNVEDTEECPTGVRPNTDTATLHNIPKRIVENCISETMREKGFEDEKTTDEIRDKTILETANLMRESVLLSPTFVATDTDIDTGELEIFNIIQSGSHQIADQINDISADTINQHLDINIEDLNTLCKRNYTLPVSSIHNSNENHEKPESIQFPSKSRSSSVSESNCLTTGNEVTNILNTPTRARSPDDHTDEAYLSDCSNSNLGPLETAEVTNYIPKIHSESSSLSNSKNKINIIHEEILSQSQLKEIKRLHSPKVTELIEVSLDALIKEKYAHDMSTSDSLDRRDPEHNSARTYGNNVSNREHSESLKNIVLFDDQGNIIETVKEVVTECTNIKNTVLMNSCDKSQEKSHISANSGEQTAENSFGVSVDIAVTDIDMQLREKEDILENFVDEIATNDDKEILEKIEKTKQECSLNLGNDIKAVPILTVNNLVEPSSKIMFVDSSDSNDITKLYVNTFEINSKVTVPESNNAINIKDLTSNDFIKNVSIKNEKSYSEIGDNNLKQSSVVHDSVMASELKEDNDYDTYQHKDTVQIKNNTDSGLDNNIKNELTLNENRVAVPVNKVQEIAMYLSQFAKNRAKVDKIKTKSVSKLVLAKHAKRNESSSKLHIQGRDKPGRSEKDDRKIKIIPNNLKTYSNSKKKCNNTRGRLPLVNVIKNQVEINIEDSVIDYNIGTDDNGSRIPEFCNCNDFGRLEYYDSECFYEHIHFWEHELVGCNRKLLFSIYDDIQTDFSKFDASNVEEDFNDNQESQTYIRSICWNSVRNNNVGHKWYGENCAVVNECNNSTKSLTDKVENASFLCLDKDKEQVTHEVFVELVKNSEYDIVGLDDGMKSDLKREKIKKSNIELEEHQIANFNTEINAKAKKRHAARNIKDVNTSCKRNCALPETLIPNLNENPYKEQECIQPTKKPKSSLDHELKCFTVGSEVTDLFKISTRAVITDGYHNKDYVKLVHNSESQMVGLRDIELSDLNNFESTSTKLNMGKIGTNVICIDPVKNITSNAHCSKITLYDEDLTKKMECSTTKNTIIEKNPIESSSTNDNQIKKTMKRKASSTKEDSDDVINAEEAKKKSVKCGVCKQILTKAVWKEHASQEHCFIAWEIGTSIDFEDPELLKNLQAKIKIENRLTCSHCNSEHTTADGFLSHAKKCKESKHFTVPSNIAVPKEISDNSEQIQPVENKESATTAEETIVSCCFCKHNLLNSEWMGHIAQKHNYIAWKDGEQIDLADQQLLVNLKAKIKAEKILNCPFCKIEYKTVNKFLAHVKKCLERASQTSSSSNIYQETKDTSKPIKVEENKGSMPSEDNVLCAVCKENLPNSEWMKHIEQKHDYMAWKDGDCPLDLKNQDNIRQHLTKIIKQFGGLKCHRCGIFRKLAKLFMTHVKKCKHNEVEPASDRATEMVAECEDEDRTLPLSDIIKCGVCGIDVDQSTWYNHIGKEHDYLAWKQGEMKLDDNDKELVYKHLYNISKMYNGLICNKCGRNRKYVKSYLQHIQNCTGNEVSNNSMNGPVDSILSDKNMTVCGVCQKEVMLKNWISHIQMTHNYLAWKAGESLDLNNKEEVRNHLDAILQELGGLFCSKCNVDQRDAEGYIKHVKSCSDKSEVVCALCSENMTLKQWPAHRMNTHYNVAWIEGQTPIDLQNPVAVERFIKEYRDNVKKLVCNVCRTSRVSCIGFYAHIIVCGKSEEEAEIHKRTCELCNKKYLCVYESQHMTYHKEQQLLKEKKLRQAEAKKEVKEVKVEVEVTPGRRRAAQKAKTVIEEYQKDLNQYAHRCPCGFSTDSNIDLENHKCSKAARELGESDESVKLEGSEDESEDSDVDSDVSNEEEQVLSKRIREYAPASAKIQKFPFTPSNVDSYLNSSGAEYCRYHFQPKRLFVEWSTTIWEPVQDDQLSIYLPSVEESCQIKLSDKSWTSYKTLEGNTLNLVNAGCCHTVFAGGHVSCVSWVPPAAGKEDTFGHFLALIAQPGPDQPHLPVEHVDPQPGLIQIWDFGKFHKAPKFALGIAHDYGVAWAMDWCPSGARDAITEVCTADVPPRLGLLAAAFSCGVVYIFSVPYPCAIVKNDKLIYKLKPVVELRLNSIAERKIVQATSIRWSPQKNHKVVLVGYSDGTMGFFDLTTESPLLKTKEHDVTIIYPYHDNRVLNTCLTGVDMFPSMDSSVRECVCASSPSGAALVARAGVRASAARASLACAGAAFLALWPSAVLCSEDCGASKAVTEVSWLGGGRRAGAGGAGAAAGCARCGRAARAAPPALAAAPAHPAAAHQAAPRELVGVFQMVPLGKKRKLKNDALQTKKEPLTYEEAIKKYGIEVTLNKSTLKQMSPVHDMYPERFPLADVTSMAFCPSPKHHHRLAVALHAGFVFVITVN